jgi:acetoin:2,6-dichlorophenolindophenol oxidoreductase subunit alpha
MTETAGTDLPATAVGAGALDTGAALEGYGRMLLIREFETQMHRLFLKGEVHGTTHLCAGQEAVPVGVCLALEADDYVAGTYRGHGHALAKGTEPEALMAEMLGRVTGVCGGRAGSMNVIDLDHGLVGCYGIVGGSMAAATGAALSAKRQGRVSAAFFGDGATNHGYFHECLNFAQVLALPVVFVCENNLYGEFTPWEDVTAGQIRSRPEALEIPAATIDGNDVWTVRAAAREAVAHARGGEGPYFIEALTYRFVGHSRSDPGAYRKPGELDAWRSRDPLTLARAALAEVFDVTEPELSAVESSVQAELAAAVEAGLASPYPDPAAAREFKDQW